MYLGYETPFELDTVGEHDQDEQTFVQSTVSSNPCRFHVGP